MRAVLMNSTGGPEVLSIEEVKRPEPKNKEVLVKLKAAGINPLDWKMRKKGTRYPENMPAILGCDGAGVIEEIGPEVKKFKLGDEVYFCHGGIGDHPGNYAEYAVIDENFAAFKPATLSFAEAAASPLVLITAWESLFNRVSLKKGQTVLIHAGAGGVGHVGIQLAKNAGCNVITTVSNYEKENLVKSIGADYVINYKTTDFAESALDYTNGKGVDIVLDTIGAQTFVDSLDALKIYGQIVTILSPPSDINWGPLRVKNIRVAFELMLTPMTENLVEGKRLHAAILENCAELFDSQKLKIHVAKTFPFEEASIAHKFAETGNFSGKIVLEV